MLLSPALPKNIYTQRKAARVGREPLVTAEQCFRQGSLQPHLLGIDAGWGSLERVPVPCEGLAALGLALEDLVFRKRFSMISFKQGY